MSINNLFEKGNKFFLVQNYIGGLEVYKQILFKYPKNIRLSEEINKKIKKFIENKQAIIFLVYSSTCCTPRP